MTHQLVSARTVFPYLFFFNDTATTEIYTLSLHDALPISVGESDRLRPAQPPRRLERVLHHQLRSEEHTSELQSRQYLVCRLLLEKKKYISIVLSYLAHRFYVERATLPMRSHRAHVQHDSR